MMYDRPDEELSEKMQEFFEAARPTTEQFVKAAEQMAASLQEVGKKLNEIGAKLSVTLGNIKEIIDEEDDKPLTRDEAFKGVFNKNTRKRHW